MINNIKKKRKAVAGHLERKYNERNNIGRALGAYVQ
jgi:hypothetical protein